MVVSDFVGEQSRVHIMPISAKWKHKSSIHSGFIIFNGGVTTFFAKSVYGCGIVFEYIGIGVYKRQDMKNTLLWGFSYMIADFRPGNKLSTYGA